MGASLCFSCKLLLNATCGEMRNYFHAIMGKQGHEMYSSVGKITKVITHIKLFQVLGVFQNYNPSTLVWSAEQIPRQQEEEDLE